MKCLGNPSWTSREHRVQTQTSRLGSNLTVRPSLLPVLCLQNRYKRFLNYKISIGTLFVSKGTFELDSINLRTRAQFFISTLEVLIFCFLLRPGNGPFCWTKEDQEALTDVSIVLAADGDIHTHIDLLEHVLFYNGNLFFRELTKPTVFNMTYV